MLRNISETQTKILNSFSNYIISRTNTWGRFITFIFRNNALTEEKINLANKVIQEMKNFTGSQIQLIKLLNDKKNEHMLLSRKYDKNHFNLEERKPITITTIRVVQVDNATYYEYLTDKRNGIEGIPPIHVHETTAGQTIYTQEYKTTYLRDDVKPGENSNRSELAEIFHESLRMLR